LDDLAIVSVSTEHECHVAA